MMWQGKKIQRNFVAGLVVPVLLAGCFMDDPTMQEMIGDAPPPTGNNTAPEIQGSPPRVVKVSVNYSFTPQAMDPDGDPLSFSINNRPTWLTFNTTSGHASGVPLPGHEGTYNDIEIAVSDGHVSTMLPRFSISVEPLTAPNMPPEIDGTPAISVDVGDTYTFTPAGSDPDGDPLTFSIQNRPGWATFSSSTGQLAGTPQPGDEGTYSNIAITVSDNVSAASLPAFSITVIAVTTAPPVDITPPTNPTGLSATAIGERQIDLAWAASTDNVGVVGYYVYQDGNQTTPVATATTLSYSVLNLTPNTLYAFEVAAFDLAGNESGLSNVATATTMSSPPPPPPPPPGGRLARGIPDPTGVMGYDPFATFTVDSTNATCNPSGSGSASNPYVIDMQGQQLNCGNAGMRLSGSYVILQNVTVNATDEDGLIAEGCNNCTVRDVNVYGTQQNLGHGSVLGFGSPFVWLRGEVAYFGDTRYSAPENDAHGLKSYGPDHWIIDAHFHDLAGDGVQAGDASRGRARNVYVSGGVFHSNRENCLDIKDSDNIIFSGFTCYNQLNGDEPGIVIHDDATDIQILDATFYDMNWALVISGQTRVTVNGNNITANNVGIEVRSANVNITGNTINAPTCINQQGGVSGTVQSGCN